MYEAGKNPRVWRKVVIGVVKAAFGSLVISFEFFAGTSHGFTSLHGTEGIGRNALALCVYAFGFLLISSAIKDCPFSGRPK